MICSRSISANFLHFASRNFPSQDKFRFSTMSQLWRHENFLINKSYQNYETTSYADHISKTRKLILHAGKHLDGNGRVIVLGPGLIEPLNKLAKISKELVLVDFDEHQLKTIAKDLPKEKVTLFKTDLSGGFSEQIDDLITQMSKNSLLPIEVIEKLIKLFNNFQIKCLPSELRDADLLVSSLIGTQLFAQPIHLSNMAFFKQHKVELYDYAKSESEVLELYKSGFRKIKDLMAKKHIKDLHQMLKATGTLYFADTTHWIVIGKNQETINCGATVSEGAFNKFPQNFRLQECHKWNWIASPEDNYGFFVESGIFQKKE